MTDDSGYPKMTYMDELMQSMADGTDMMINMVRASMFEQSQLPPPEILKWYVLNTAYRLVASEYKAVYTSDVEAELDLMVTVDELEAVRAQLNRQKQFGLLADVETILRTRKLHLPPTFDASYGGRL